MELNCRMSYFFKLVSEVEFFSAWLLRLSSILGCGGPIIGAPSRDDRAHMTGLWWSWWVDRSDSGFVLIQLYVWLPVFVRRELTGRGFFLLCCLWPCNRGKLIGRISYQIVNLASLKPSVTSMSCLTQGLFHLVGNVVFAYKAGKRCADHV